MLVTYIRKKDTTLNCILYIYYLVFFWKSDNIIKTLINYNSKVYIITSIYALKLSFCICKTDAEAQKTDRLSVKIFEMVIVAF